MSVRRLAEDIVQPVGFAFSDENASWAERTIGRYPEGRQQSAVIPLLMRAQEQDGWVTKAAIEHVADRLRMPLIRVLEVATFYTQFQLKPVGTRAHVQVCGTTPCMLRGSDALKDVCRQRIHHDQFHLNEAGTLSWEEVECLGACVNAPMVMIFKDTYEDLTPERLAEIIDAFEEGEGPRVRVGPQIDRHLSAPLGGATTLLSEDGRESARDDAGSGPVEKGAPPQGPGAGGEGSLPQSQAGRPDTHAAETDPTIAAPGKAASGDVGQLSEGDDKVDIVEGAGRPGAGQTGGSRQGPTGAAEKDADAVERGSVSKDNDEARRDGPLGAKGDAAESAVVKDDKRVDAPEGAGAKSAPATDARSSDGTGRLVEGNRLTDDVLPGPVASDDLGTNEPKRKGRARRSKTGDAQERTEKESGDA